MITEQEVRETLKQVVDPEVGINIVDMGLVYTVSLSEETDRVTVEMTLTSPMCPAGPQIIEAARHSLEAVEDMGQVYIEVVWNPPWSPEMMSDDAKDELGIF